MSEVEAKEISKTYFVMERKINALTKVSFSAASGEVLALLGPNGAGKTTTFNIFANLTSADSGEVKVLGLGPADKRYYEKISFVSSETQFLWTLSGAQILKFYTKMRGLERDAALPIIRELELETRIDRKWHQMSSGERMRLRLAKGLLTKPEVLFLDEPTIGLDPDIADRLRHYLILLKERGLCIVLTSHLMLDVEALADKMCFIKGGKIIYSGKLGKEYFEPTLEITFDGKKAYPDYCNVISDNTVRVHPKYLPEIIKLGGVVEVNTLKNDLESLFIKLVRNKEGANE